MSGTTMTFRSPPQPSGSTGVMIVLLPCSTRSSSVFGFGRVRRGASASGGVEWLTWLPPPVADGPATLGARSLARRQT